LGVRRENAALSSGCKSHPVIAPRGKPCASWMGELLPSRHHHQSVPDARQLHSSAGTPVVALQAQCQATQGRDLSTLAPLRVLWARTPDRARARRAVGEGVKSCPRAGCGRSARPGSTSGMWKRSHGRTTKAPPDERGGKQICSAYSHRATSRLI
jgi:hypothetical protein